MNIFDDYTHKLLSTLLKNEVQFIVVGGYAVNYHGYRRTTGDIDLLIKPDNGNNKTQIIASLRNLGIEEGVLKTLEQLNFEEALVFIDGEEPFKIDFITKISGVNFDDAWASKIEATYDNLSIPFLNYNHLILSKISTNRAKDKIDVEELQKINALKKK
jgi:predicted nucleotidyltransferase